MAGPAASGEPAPGARVRLLRREAWTGTALGAASVGSLAQSCDSSCAPPISSRPTEPSTITVCFKEGDWDSYGDAAGMVWYGMAAYWSEWLESNNITDESMQVRFGTGGDPDAVEEIVCALEALGVAADAADSGDEGAYPL